MSLPIGHTPGIWLCRFQKQKINSQSSTESEMSGTLILAHA